VKYILSVRRIFTMHRCFMGLSRAFTCMAILLLVLAGMAGPSQTAWADDGVPVQTRCSPGNTDCNVYDVLTCEAAANKCNNSNVNCLCKWRLVNNVQACYCWNVTGN